MKGGILNLFEMLSLYLMRLRVGLTVIDLVYGFQICKIAVSKVFFISVRCALRKTDISYQARTFRINSFYVNMSSIPKLQQ